MTRMGDAIAAKLRQVREEWESRGFDVVEWPGEEEFPFDAGLHRGYRPALLARRGGVNVVVEIREATRLGHSLLDRVDEIRKHPGWHLYLVTCDDVIPYDAPGVQGNPPEWGRLDSRAEQAIRLSEPRPKTAALLELWAVLEGMLRRIAVDHGIPTDRLPAALLITSLYDYGHLPFDTYEPLSAALEVHRRVVHGYEVPEPDLDAAVGAVADALPKILAENLQDAS